MIIPLLESIVIHRRSDMIQGIGVDPYTASMVLKVYGTVDCTIKAKMERMTVPTLIRICERMFR